MIKLISILTHLEEVGGSDLGIKLGYSGQLSSVLGATQRETECYLYVPTFSGTGSDFIAFIEGKSMCTG